MFVYYRDNGEVVMTSETAQTVSNLNVVEITPTQEETDKLNDDYDVILESGTLQFKESIYKTKETRDLVRRGLKQDLVSVTDVDPKVKEILNFLLQ